MQGTLRYGGGSMLVEPVVNRTKLDELLAEQHESESLDYKRRLDLNETRDRVELAKDVGAMQSVGGYIVVGADDRGVPVADLAPAEQGLFDDATIRDKLRKYLSQPIDIRCGRHEIDGKHLALIYVAKTLTGCRSSRPMGSTRTVVKSAPFFAKATSSCVMDRRASAPRRRTFARC